MPLIRKDPPPTGAPQPAGGGLTAGTPDERWAAARAMGDVPGSVGELARALAAEPDARVREAILTSLARLGGPEAVDAVLPHLRSDEANLRAGALDALRAMPQSVRPRVEALLRDGDADVRILACELLRSLPADEANGILAAVLETDPEVNVCAAALDVLAEVGTAEALPALARCAARFPGEAFLGFAIKVTAEKLSLRDTGGRG